MATTSPTQTNELQIVSPIDGEDVVAAARVPLRRILGSTGMSILIHFVAMLVLSLIALVQQDTSPPLAIEGDFSELIGDGEAALDLSEPNLLEIDTTPLNLPTITELIAPDSGAAAEAKVDLAVFASTNAGSGLPTAAAAIASGIQGRVQKAGGRSGEVQFSLAWKSLNDLDLHVIVPSGEHISFSHRTSRCKGNLDVDMNAETTESNPDQSFSEEPVENVRWLDRTAPSGRYTVIVNQYRWRGGRQKDPFQLLVKLGDQTQIIEDEVSAWKSISVHRFQYVKSSLPKARRETLAEELSTLQEREETQATELYQAAFIMPKDQDRDRKMLNVIIRFPHTDASILAMQELTPVEKK
jgi:hypothetical protein